MKEYVYLVYVYKGVLADDLDRKLVEVYGNPETAREKAIEIEEKAERTKKLLKKKHKYDYDKKLEQFYLRTDTDSHEYDYIMEELRYYYTLYPELDIRKVKIIEKELK